MTAYISKTRSQITAKMSAILECANANPEAAAASLVSGIRIFSDLNDSVRTLAMCRQLVSENGASVTSLIYAGENLIKFRETEEAIRVFEATSAKATKQYQKEDCLLGICEARIIQNNSPDAASELRRLSTGASTAVIRKKATALIQTLLGTTK